MDQLMSSLLVWRDGHLMPASSASAIDVARKQKQDVKGDTSFEAFPDVETLGTGSESGLTSDTQRVQDRANASDHNRPRVSNDSEQPPAAVQGADEHSHPVTAELRLQSHAAQAQNTSRLKLGGPGLPLPPRSAFRISSATPSQVTKARVKSFDKEKPSINMDLKPQMTLDVDMGDLATNHSLLLSGRPVIMQSMEEFEAAHPYQPPPPKATPHRSSTKHGEYSSLFHITCQDRGLKPDFHYREPAKGCFEVSLSIDGTLVDTIGLYASKKDAKEEVSKLAMSKIDSFGNCKKRSASTFEQDRPLPEGLHDERWINVVYEYCQGRKLGNPDFEETGVHPSTGPFMCTLTFKGSPLTPFGSDLGTFKKKVDAKLAAAQQAVSWLRSQGLIAQAPQKRRKSSDGSQTLAPGEADETGVGSTGLRQMDANSPATQGSIAEQVARLLVELGFPQPTFEFERLEGGSFYNVQATFEPVKGGKLDTRLVGKVGRVEGVYGKKEAKSACWKQLQTIFEAIRLDEMATNAFP